MAFNDSLFQLGMDLTRSSTTQTEDLVCKTTVDTSDRVGDRVDGQDTTFAGTHLIIDLVGAKRLDDACHIEAVLRHCADVAGREVLAIHLHRSGATGLAGVAVLDGGHITVSTRPDAGFAAFDVFVAGNAKPHLTVDLLRDAFDADDVVLKGHHRGTDTSSRGWNIGRDIAAPARPSKATPRHLRAKRVA